MLDTRKLTTTRDTSTLTRGPVRVDVRYCGDGYHVRAYLHYGVTLASGIAIGPESADTLRAALRDLRAEWATWVTFVRAVEPGEVVL